MRGNILCCRLARCIDNVRSMSWTRAMCNLGDCIPNAALRLVSPRKAMPLVPQPWHVVATPWRMPCCRCQSESAMAGDVGAGGRYGRPGVRGHLQRSGPGRGPAGGVGGPGPLPGAQRGGIVRLHRQPPLPSQRRPRPRLLPVPGRQDEVEILRGAKFSLLHPMCPSGRTR